MSHLSKFEIERSLANEVDDSDVTAHLDECDTCRARADALRADRETFAEEVPYAAFRVEHQRRMARRTTGRRHLWLVAPALAVMVALWLVVLPEGPSERPKGAGVALNLFDATGEPMPTGAVVKTGARLQLAYDAGPHAFLALLGIDESGTVSRYFPEGPRLAPLPAGARGAFPFGLELDATPGVERFFLVLADRPEPVAPVFDAARSIAHTDLRVADRLPVPSRFAQTTVWLLKQEDVPGN